MKFPALDHALQQLEEVGKILTSPSHLAWLSKSCKISLKGKKISEEEMGFFLNNQKYNGYKVVHPMNNAPEAR
jgi:hypothetical protein